MFQFNKKIQESLDLTESLVLSSPRVLCPRFFLQGPGSLYRVLGPGSSQSTVSCSQDLGSSVLSVGSLVVNPHRILGLGSVYMVLGTWSSYGLHFLSFLEGLVSWVLKSFCILDSFHQVLGLRRFHQCPGSWILTGSFVIICRYAIVGWIEERKNFFS